MPKLSRKQIAGSLNASKRKGEPNAVAVMQTMLIWLTPKDTDTWFLKPNEEKIDFPNYIEGIRPYCHAAIIELFFNADGTLKVDDDDVAEGGLREITFSNFRRSKNKGRRERWKKNPDVRYQLEIRKGEMQSGLFCADGASVDLFASVSNC
jgi:hypothetical protein